MQVGSPDAVGRAPELLRAPLRVPSGCLSICLPRQTLRPLLLLVLLGLPPPCCSTQLSPALLYCRPQQQQVPPAVHASTHACPADASSCSLRERRRCVVVLLCGTSGSGKSTLASILVGARGRSGSNGSMLAAS